MSTILYLEIQGGMTINQLLAKLLKLPGNGVITVGNVVAVDQLEDPKAPCVVSLPVEVK